MHRLSVASTLACYSERAPLPTLSVLSQPALTMTGGPKSSAPCPWGGSSSSFVAIFVINPQELLRYKPVEVQCTVDCQKKGEYVLASVVDLDPGGQK